MNFLNKLDLVWTYENWSCITCFTFNKKTLNLDNDSKSKIDWNN